MRGVSHTRTLRIPLKIQPKPRTLGFFDYELSCLISLPYALCTFSGIFDYSHIRP